MRATAPVMSGFVIYLLALATSVFGFRRTRKNLLQGKYLATLLFFVVTLAGGFVLLEYNENTIFGRSYNFDDVVPNQPIGVERGIHPGRVVWVHNPGVASWDGSTGFWWDDKYTSQEGTGKMLPAALLELTGENNLPEAWKSLFRYFNQKKHNVNAGYQEHQKIAIKINQNNTYSHADTEELNASPQLTLELLRSLVYHAGVPQENITIFDASRYITDYIYNKCHSEFPQVKYVDYSGGNGRIKTSYIENAIPYSIDNGALAKGLSASAVEADYIINMALLKGHVGQGVTLCAKNWYGVTNIYDDWRKNAHNNFDQDRQGKPKYMTFVDFMGHKDLGEKTLLFLIDGLYGSKSVAGPPAPKWKMLPFNGNWPCSLFASQDGVAIDAVGLDFLRNEWPDAPDMKYSDHYLIEAALAGTPPSKSIYDPERDSVGLTSLGVMEHWNNATEKKYSRNLGKSYGIELIYKKIEE